MRTMLNVECDACGKKVYRRPYDITRSVTKRFFCSKECWSTYRHEIVEKATGLPEWARIVLSSAKKRAKNKGLEFSITQLDMVEMIAESNGKCALSGLKFDFSESDKKHQRRPHFPSLDRVDSSKGYISGNVRLVCVAINLAMNSWGEDILFGIAVAMLGDALPFQMYRGRYVPIYRKERIGTFDNRPEAIRAYINAKKNAAKIVR